MRRREKAIWTGFGTFLLAMLAFVLFLWFNFRTIEVKGDSMLDTFQSGDRLLVTNAYWLVGPVKRGDIVVVRNPQTKELIIKRVNGMGGDSIDFNLMPVAWPFSRGEFTVPEGTIYVIGDNYAVSQDSRQFGPLPIEDVVGKVVILRRGGSGPTPAAASE